MAFEDEETPIPHTAKGYAQRARRTSQPFARPNSRTVSALESAQALTLMRIVTLVNTVLSDAQIERISAELGDYAERVRTLESARVAQLFADGELPLPGEQDKEDEHG